MAGELFVARSLDRAGLRVRHDVIKQIVVLTGVHVDIVVHARDVWWLIEVKTMSADYDVARIVRPVQKKRLLQAAQAWSQHTNAITKVALAVCSVHRKNISYFIIE